MAPRLGHVHHTGVPKFGLEGQSWEVFGWFSLFVYIYLLVALVLAGSSLLEDPKFVNNNRRANSCKYLLILIDMPRILYFDVWGVDVECVSFSLCT